MLHSNDHFLSHLNAIKAIFMDTKCNLSGNVAHSCGNFANYIFLFYSCKAQKNFNCFFAIIMGLNSAAVSRLTQTWEVLIFLLLNDYKFRPRFMVQMIIYLIN